MFKKDLLFLPIQEFEKYIEKEKLSSTS